jgi:hypothetical protein
MIKQKSILLSLSSLFLLSLSGITYGQQTNTNCSESHLSNGSVCQNTGVVNNNTYIYNYPTSPPNEPPSHGTESSRPIKQPQDPFVRHRPSTPQESLISDEKLPPYPTF